MLHLALLLSLTAAPPPWVHAGEAGGVHWYTRQRDGVPVNELRATVLLDATRDEVWAVLTDYAGWTETMPSTQVAEVLDRPAPGRLLVYLRYALPVIAPRDALVELEETRDDAAWTLTWHPAPDTLDAARPLPKGVVRLRVNEGRWRLEAREGGAKTFLTYELLSAPGGDVPPFFVNSVNTLGVPKTMDSLKRAIAARRKR